MTNHSSLSKETTEGALRFASHDNNTHQKTLNASYATHLVNRAKSYYPNFILTKDAQNQYEFTLKEEAPGELTKPIEAYIKTLSKETASYLLKIFNENLVEAFDKVPLTMEVEGQWREVYWWLPLKESFGVILQTLMSESGWPADSTLEKRISAFTDVNDGLTKAQPCHTGVRNTWISLLNGYNDLNLAMEDTHFRVKCIREYVYNQLGGDSTYEEKFIPLYYPWLITQEMPVQTLQEIHSEDLIAYIKARFFKRIRS